MIKTNNIGFNKEYNVVAFNLFSTTAFVLPEKDLMNLLGSKVQ